MIVTIHIRYVSKQLMYVSMECMNINSKECNHSIIDGLNVCNHTINDGMNVCKHIIIDGVNVCKHTIIDGLNVYMVTINDGLSVYMVTINDCMQPLTVYMLRMVVCKQYNYVWNEYLYTYNECM